jgi:hypothetical protein
MSARPMPALRRSAMRPRGGDLVFGVTAVSGGPVDSRGHQKAALVVEAQCLDREPGSRGELGGSQFLHDAIMKRAPGARSRRPGCAADQMREMTTSPHRRAGIRVLRMTTRLRRDDIFAEFLHGDLAGEYFRDFPGAAAAFTTCLVPGVYLRCACDVPRRGGAGQRPDAPGRRGGSGRAGRRRRGRRYMPGTREVHGRYMRARGGPARGTSQVHAR